MLEVNKCAARAGRDREDGEREMNEGQEKRCSEQNSRCNSHCPDMTGKSIVMEKQGMLWAS